MNEKKNTKGPVAEQVPATPATEQATSTAPAIPGLPSGYLADGYHATSDKGTPYLRSEFVGTYAQQIAAALAPIRSADFSNLLREMKRSKKKALPFEARQTAAIEMLPKALALTHRNKAPAVLIDFIQANLDAIKTDDDWYAYLRHLEAISSFLILDRERGGDTSCPHQTQET